MKWRNAGEVSIATAGLRLARDKCKWHVRQRSIYLDNQAACVHQMYKFVGGVWEIQMFVSCSRLKKSKNNEHEKSRLKMYETASFFFKPSDIIA